MLVCNKCNNWDEYKKICYVTSLSTNGINKCIFEKSLGFLLPVLMVIGLLYWIL